MLSEDLGFDAETQNEPICVTVQLEDDAVLEEDEYFYLTIVAGSPVSSSLSSLTASVIILNDDSE